MNRFLIVLMIVLTCVAVAACATPGVKPKPSEAVEATDSRDNDTLANNDSEVMAHNDPAERSTGIEELEAPKVDEIPRSMIPGVTEPELAIVCERVVPTGSILPVTVCRDRLAAEKKQAADQEIFDDIKRNTAIFNSRL
jgi:hypothetical protein